jgi:acyl-coenzyme A thioesterase PaaI-like protein
LEIPLAIFEPLDAPHHWQPSPLAAGPFAGLQGGAVASLLTAEIEAIAETRNWGTAVSATAWFLRPTPMAKLRTQLAVLTEGGRVSVVDNTLWADNEEHPCATVRVTLSRERAIEIPGFAEKESDNLDPGSGRATCGLPTASPGSWTPWRRAWAATSPGFALTIQSSPVPARYPACSDLRTGPMALRVPSRTSSRIPIQT